MSFFFRPKPELGIIFDIGSSSVGAGLVRFDPNGHVHVVHTFRESVPYQAKVNPERLFKDMIHTLAQVNDAIVKQGTSHLRFTQFGGLTIKHVFYVFSSPWAATETKTIHVTQPQPFTFTKTLTDRIMAEEVVAFQKNVEDVVVIENRIIDISLNGYSVVTPYGKKTKKAELSLFMSLIPKVVLDKVSDVSLATYHPKDTKLFSFPLAAFSILRDTFHQTADFIFLDIGGEVADVFVVKGGLILQTASFPAGKHFIIRHLADNLAVTYMQAESMMNLHLEGHGSKEHAAHMDLVLENASREWTKIFHETIIKASDVVSLPRKLFVLVDGPLVGFFLKSLKEEKVAQFGVTETPFEVTLVTSDSFKGGVSFANRTHRDSSLALIAAFVGRKK